MRTLGTGELRLLSRLAIEPSLRQAELARDLHVSRSAVNQVWQNLEDENQLRIRGSLDYGKTGLQLVFGWAVANEETDSLKKFSRWLETIKLVTRVLKSQISSIYKSVVYFEALLPLDDLHSWFQSQLDRFRKRPYSLTIYSTQCLKVSHHLNLGLFDGGSWTFPDSFRLEASIGAAKGYVDILPVVGTVEQTSPVQSNLEEMIAAAAVEYDFHATAARLASLCIAMGIEPDSGRTLRRRVARARTKLAHPYVEIDNIGLDQHIMVVIRDEQRTESEFSRLLHAQAGSFPRARVLSGYGLTALDLDTPINTKWLELSQVMAGLVGKSSETCTFIASQGEKVTQLESVVSYLASRMSSG